MQACLFDSKLYSLLKAKYGSLPREKELETPLAISSAKLCVTKAHPLFTYAYFESVKWCSSLFHR